MNGADVGETLLMVGNDSVAGLPIFAFGPGEAQGTSALPVDSQAAVAVGGDVTPTDTVVRAGFGDHIRGRDGIVVRVGSLDTWVVLTVFAQLAQGAVLGLDSVADAAP